MGIQKSALDFKESKIEVFMGGDLKLPERPRTASELAAYLELAAREVRTWGNDTELSEVHFSDNQISVTLKKGIVLGA